MLGLPWCEMQLISSQGSSSRGRPVGSSTSLNDPRLLDYTYFVKRRVKVRTRSLTMTCGEVRTDRRAQPFSLMAGDEACAGTTVKRRSRNRLVRANGCISGLR